MYYHSDIAIIKTLIYADVFEYPLTRGQIKKYIIDEKLTAKEVDARLAHLSSLVGFRRQFFFLRGHESTVLRRRIREKESRNKFKKAKRFAKLLAFIPTIEMIGLSGSLAMRNSDLHDDIDFFIITRPNALWISRFAAIILLMIFGIKRDRGARYAKDKICLNMFVTTHDLATSRERKNLFVAHEIIQVIPLINRHLAYERFIQKNKWVIKFLPNSISEKKFVLCKKSTFVDRILSRVLYPIESISYGMQSFYMRKHRTQEIVSRTRAEFYPFITKNPMVELYYLRLTYTLSLCSRAQGNNEELASKGLN